MPSRLERFLRLFTEVRPGEGPTALLMFANVFLILCAYYFIKPLREGWIAVSDIGELTKMEVKAYSSFGQSLLLVPVVALYGWLSTRLGRVRLVTRATLFCMSNLVIFWFLQPGFFIENLPYTGVVFYLWIGVFSVFVVAQFFAFAADVYADDRGDRLMPLVALGATSGAAVGSMLIGPMVESGTLGSEYVLLFALLPLAGSIVLTHIVDRREPQPAPDRPEDEPEESGADAFWLISNSRLLLGIAVVTLLLNWVNTNGENLLFRVVQENLASTATDRGIVDPSQILLFTKDQTTAFYGNFFLWVNVAAVFLQGFVASRLLKFGGFGVLLMALPVVALVSYAAMALVPILIIVKFMKVAENATDYSINNTARHVLWLPISAGAKYKGKPTIDSLFARIGDGLAALTVMVGVNLLTLPTNLFFAFNVSLVVVWILFAFRVIREHRKVSEGEPVTPSNIPSELRRWNWGAFWLTWVWGLGNHVYVALWIVVPMLAWLLVLIPGVQWWMIIGLNLLTFIFILALGAKGNEWAWKRSGTGDSVAFLQAQRRWALAGFAALLVTLAFVLISLLAPA